MTTRRLAGVEMRSWDALPAVFLSPLRPLAADFTARGVTNFRAAGHYLEKLPYGRTAERADFRAVLREGRGTCSTKHALLAALAEEQGVAVVLTLGIYEMHERNTPGVGAVLSRYGLPYVPEAHCYLAHEGTRIDVTRSGAASAEAIAGFLHEEPIVPKQIGDYKATLHRRFMREWVARAPEIVGALTFNDVWAIREECIRALAQ
ncbi:MAG TPA: hypothetical protein VGL09_07330 [Methylomirabilota bacterium]